MPGARKQAPEIMTVVATVVSAAAHLALITVGAASLPSLLRPPTSASQAPALSESAAQHADTIDIELPEVSSSSVATPGPPTPSAAMPAMPTGGQGIPRPDNGRSGRGGTDTASQPGVNLADRDDGLLLARDLISHLDRSQVSRVRSAQRRRSWDDERLTTNPMELTFLATGVGRDQERREPAETSPSRGLAHASVASVAGGDRIGREPLPDGYGADPVPPGTDQLGSDRASPGTGILDNAPGVDHRTAAASELARPLVDQGSPSVTSDTAGSPQDTTDSRQEVAAKALHSLVDSSTAGGRPGEGPGGQKGDGRTGAGGVDGPGSRSRPMGYGPGAYGASGVDPRMTAYQRRVASRIYPFWEHAFPHWAIAEFRQGTVFVAFEILADGRVRNVHVTRPSGIDEFDRNCVAAVVRAAPFEPIPSNLGVRTLRWELSFDASNPLVR